MTEWRPISGAKNYEVSNDGRVRSLDRTIQTSNGQCRRYSGKLLRWTTNQYGHHKVPVRMDCGKVKLLYIHSLVALGFIGKRPVGKEVAHSDGNPNNNRLENLRYATPKENQQDKIKHGTCRRHAQHPGARLTNASVSHIKDLLRLGVRQRDIASHFGIARSTVSAISTGRSWA